MASNVFTRGLRVILDEAMSNSVAKIHPGLAGGVLQTQSLPNFGKLYFY